LSSCCTGGGTGKAAAEETGWGAKADKEGFLAVFPDALPPDPAKPSRFAGNPQLWNDGSDRFYPGQKAPDDVAFLNAMLDELAARFAVDPRRVFMTGFSNGASMCFRFGAEASMRLAAIAPVAGACWLETITLERPVPMCYLTGTADPLNPIEGGVPKLATGGSDTIRAKPKPPVRDSILKWVRAVGAPATPRTTTTANGVHTDTYGPGRDGAEVICVSVEGLGHTWAGGKSLLPASMVGPRSDTLKATDVIWRFFQARPMAASEPGPSPSAPLRPSPPVVPAEHAQLYQGLERGRTKIGAGSGSWSPPAFAQALAEKTEVDFIGIHVYPITDPMLGNARHMAQIARAHGKQAVIDEAWLYKELRPGGGDNVAAAAEVFRRDLASFWQPLDRKFITLMLGLAAEERVSLVSFFWSSLFFSYLDYTPGLDRLPYAELTRRHNRTVYSAMQEGQLSDVGRHLQRAARPDERPTGAGNQEMRTP